MNEFEKKLAEQLEAEAKKKQFQEWGKLGGRPKINKRKNKVISLRFTEEEFEKILKDFEETKLKSFSEFGRQRMQNKNPENVFDFAEIRIELKNQTNNFIRIKNYFKSGHFDYSEKQNYLRELDYLIEQNKKILEWLAVHFA